MTLEDEDNSDTDEERFRRAIEITLEADDNSNEIDEERLQPAFDMTRG